MADSAYWLTTVEKATNQLRITRESLQTNCFTVEHIGDGTASTVQNVSMPLDDDALDCTDEVADGGGNTNAWFSGCNGGHQVLGGGIIGSAEAT